MAKNNSFQHEQRYILTGYQNLLNESNSLTSCAETLYNSSTSVSLKVISHLNVLLTIGMETYFFLSQ